MDSSKPRYLSPAIREDLADKLVFLGGPRQVGKTTLALNILNGTSAHPAYLNWDIPEARSKVLKGDIPPNQPLVILDEIHKYVRWRGLVKGLYDRYTGTRQFLITGSARLDYYRKGGDSLQGRYHYYRLHPFSLMELSHTPSTTEMNSLLKFGGFPEPLFKGDERHLRRWHRERLDRVIHGDLRDLERVRELSLIDLLVDALPERVGAPLSLNKLAEHLQVSHQSIRRWLDMLERIYLSFRIAPYGSAKIRAVKKEQKLYLWDWSMVPEKGPRWENLVACQLLKYCHLQEDYHGYRMELRYLRDVDGREVDFVVLQDRKPIFAVECKTGHKMRAKACDYFRRRTSIPRFYQVHLGDRDAGDAALDIRVIPFAAFCQELAMP